MEKFNSYQERKLNSQQTKLNSLLEQLPGFCKEYFNDPGILTLSSKEAYAREMLSFFTYVSLNYRDMDINTIDVLEKISADVIDDYQLYLRCYEKNGKEHKNSLDGIKRKVFMIKAFYEYYYNKGLIKIAPECFDMESKKRKEKTDNSAKSEKLINNAIDAVASAQNLSGKQFNYADKTHKRDLAIVRVLCCTGITLTECVGLNCEDIDWNESTIRVDGKKGVRKILIDQKTLKTLEYYMQYERKDKKNKSNDGNALFLSMQNRRMSGRAIEIMLKKYVNADIKPMDFRNARRIISQ